MPLLFFCRTRRSESRIFAFERTSAEAKDAKMSTALPKLRRGRRSYVAATPLVAEITEVPSRSSLASTALCRGLQKSSFLGIWRNEDNPGSARRGSRSEATLLQSRHIRWLVVSAQSWVAVNSKIERQEYETSPS